jgi:hypothetical protein
MANLASVWGMPVHVHVLQLYTHNSVDGHLFECVVWQRKKASESVFVPTSLKNLMVTGVFGEKVRQREVECMRIVYTLAITVWYLHFYMKVQP